MKHLLAKWTHWILAVLSPFGIWGIFGFAFVDAAFLGMPLDAIIAGYAYAAPRHFSCCSQPWRPPARRWAASSFTGSATRAAKSCWSNAWGRSASRRSTPPFERATNSWRLCCPRCCRHPRRLSCLCFPQASPRCASVTFLRPSSSAGLFASTLESLLVIFCGRECGGFILGHTLLHDHARLAIAIVAAAGPIGWWVWRFRKREAGKRYGNQP